MQPSARGTDTPGRSILPAFDMDFTILRNPGRNGMLLVMMYLAWWGALANDREEWDRAVADTSAVLSCLCASHNASSGENDENMSVAEPVPTRKRKAPSSSAPSAIVAKKTRPTRKMPPRGR